MTDVFVSYTRDDAQKAKELAQALEARGFDVWWDHELLPGEKYADKIGSTLQTCKAVVVIWSAASTTRGWVLDEAGVGRDRGVLVPVRVDASEPPLGFRQTQAEDLSKWPGEGDANFERVVAAISRLVGAPAKPPVAAAKPKFSLKSLNAMQFAAAMALVVALAAGGIIATRMIGAEDANSVNGPAPDGWGLAQAQWAALDPPDLLITALDNPTGGVTLKSILTEAEGGDAQAQTLACIAYDRGQSVEPSPQLARQWCEKAAANGQTAAQFMLAGAQVLGLYGFTPADAPVGRRAMEELAAKGDARAQYFTGATFLQEGSDAEALKWLRLAAAQSHMNAQYSLGWMLMNGRGGAANYAEAEKLFQALLDADSPLGARGLGLLYETEAFPGRDAQKAQSYFAQASARGDGEASFRIGAHLERKNDRPGALIEYKKALEQNYAPAAEAIARLEKD